MSDDAKKTEEGVNEAVKAMGKDVKSDVPVGLMTIPKGASAHAIARRTTGDIIQNELEFHCMSCGWNKTLHFDADELEAIGSIRDYTGPCPGCDMMTLVPKEAFWGKDFPSMNESSIKQKKEDAKVKAEAFVDALTDKVGPMIAGSMPKPSGDAAPADAPDAPAAPDADLPDEVDLTKLKPR